jgi:hypothetical protein
MKIKLSLLIGSLLVIVSCQSSSDNSSQSYTYALTLNGCDTGSHSFSSHDAYCNALKNDALNNNCAASLRYDTFKNECPGLSW